jgi:hypothetical protein
LTVGSVKGEEFTAEVIARVRWVDERGLVRSLSQELDKQRHLVVPQGIRRLGVQRLSSYRFRHNLFQSYLYDSLDAAQKAYLHEDLGNVLETLYGDQVAEIAAQLGRHFHVAGLADKAIHYLRLAGEQARCRNANTGAVVHFRRALALVAETPPDASLRKAAAELDERLGDVLFVTGEAVQAQAACAAVFAWTTQGGTIWRSRLQRKIGKTCERQRYYFKEALQAQDLAETALGQEPADPAADWRQEWIAIQIDRIWTAYWSKGHWREMLQRAEKTRPAVQGYGTPAQRSSFYERLVLVENRRYRCVVPEETVTYAKMSLAAGQESGDLGQVARSKFLLGFCHPWRGELDAAGHAIEAALTLAERTGC